MTTQHPAPAQPLSGQGESEHLFSYGTLQLEAVQLSTFGRRLAGQADQLPGFRLDLLEIQDPAVVATSGQTHHPVLVRCAAGDTPGSPIPGTVFAITPSELAQADAYEVAEYQRVRVALVSGRQAWVYVDARNAGGVGGD